jgi:DNA-binding winged helix-turn-helix (wHTH) protein
MESNSRPSFRAGPFILDGRTWEVRKNDEQINLSKTEFDVLYQLVERRGEIVLRDEFEHWKREGSVDRRSPVDMAVVQIRRLLGESVIETVAGKGYRIGRGLSIELISSPSSSDFERLLAIASSQLKVHTDASFRAAIENCEDLLKTGKIEDAYAVLALAYINLGHLGFCREQPAITITKANGIIDEALNHFPSFGSAYALKGLTALIYDYDWTAAEKNLTRALDLSPGNGLAHVFIAHLFVDSGDFDKGLQHARIAADIDYERAITVVIEPWFMMYAGRVADAVVLGEKVVKRFRSFAPAHAILGHIYRAAEAREKALEQYDIAMSIDFLPELPAAIGFIQAQMGHRKEALRNLDTLYKARDAGRIAYVSSLFVALVHTGLGEKQKALDALEKAYDERCDWLIQMGVDPRWKELRSEKRFLNLMRRIGLTRRPIG